MEEQVPMSQTVTPNPAPEFMPEQPQITPETLAQMKAIAKERAVRMVAAQQQTYSQQEQKVVYVRRNLTVAELLVNHFAFLRYCNRNSVHLERSDKHFASN